MKTFILGDTRKKVLDLSYQSVDCVVTSPPYYSKRDYEINFQIGLEDSPKEYIDNLVQVFKNLLPILKATSTVWVNIADTYSSYKDAKGIHRGNSNKTVMTYSPSRSPKLMKAADKKHKEQIGIPFMFALAMSEAGYLLRQTFIWDKEHGYESVKDRHSDSHEFLFLFTKEPYYYFNRTDLHGTVLKFPRGKGKNHKAAYNIELPKFCINSGCPKGGTVLDIFAGTGTTGFAAKELGNPFIMIEGNAEYFSNMVQKFILDNKV